MLGLSWISPWALVLLVLLVPFLYATRYRGLPLFRRSKKTASASGAVGSAMEAEANWKGPVVTALRALALILVVLALTDLRIQFPTSKTVAAVVVDDSPRISTGEATRILQEFASAESSVEQRPVPREGALAEQLLAAAATLPTDRARRLVVVTDGREPQATRTIGSHRQSDNLALRASQHADDDELAATLDNLRTLDIDVRFLPAGDAPLADDQAITGIEVPRLIRGGESVDVGVQLFSSGRRESQLLMELDGKPLADWTVSTNGGRSNEAREVTFPTTPGAHQLSVRFATPGGAPENDRYDTLVYIADRPHVLIVHSHNLAGRPALAAVLEDAKFKVTTQSVATFRAKLGQLDRYGVVVLDELNLTHVPEGSQYALRRYVEELGGGLLTITGTNGIRTEPKTLRELEPVRRPPAIPEPRPLELMLAIDRSSSMDGAPMAQARAAAAAAIRALRQDALVGTVAFSGSADRVMPPVNVGENGDAAANFVSQINAGGGTSIAAALNAAGRVMSDDDRYLHHVILLSDGHSAEGPAIAAANSLAGRGITITAITLGEYNPLMAQIAAIGRGRYHVTQNAGSLPALFVREAQYRQPPAQVQRPFRPQVVTAHRMVRSIDFGSGPNLLGQTLSKLKDEADVILSGPVASSAGGKQPLLAHWHRGLGQVATFTSATSGGWANDWRKWQGFRKLFEQVTWSLLKRETPEPVDLELSPIFREPGRVRLTVTVSDLTATTPPEVRMYRPSAVTSTEDAASNRGQAVELVHAGPGAWSAEFDIGKGLLITGRPLVDRNPTAAVSVDASYDPSLRSFGSDADRLAQWAEIAGGSVVGSVAEALKEAEAQRVDWPLRNWLFGLALLAYLGSLLALRWPEGKTTQSGQGARNPKKNADPLPKTPTQENPSSTNEPKGRAA